ncbi:ABC transporter permease [Paenibacillus xylanexedens]|uniref:ABC transporter permease n=1 Tax=Paenibacillus xylanexedens TaxID=528191 RepID=UPI0011A00546|nr:ABC transporter permease [Paenibacillus xylanexedens]
MVMTKLAVKLLRDVKQSLVQFTALAVVIAVGSFFYAGLNSYSKEQRAYTETYFTEHNLSDLNVYYDHISNVDATRLSEVEGINTIEARYTTDATQHVEGDKTSLKIHSIPADNQINTPTIIKGRIPSNKNEIIVDAHYAQEHHYQVGDKFRMIANERELAFTISGLVENVEYVKKNATQDHKTNGFAYVAEEAITEVSGTGSVVYNELLIDASEGYDVDQLGQVIEGQSQGLSYLDQRSKERSFGYAQIHQTMYNNSMMSKVIPLVLFLISAIILFLTMSRTIDSHRHQIGIMKALGVKDRNIMLHYMGYPVLISIAGSIMGCIIASNVFIPLVTASSATSYSLPGISFSLSLFSVIPPIFFSGFFGLLSVYFSGRSVLKERAAHAMRPKPPRKMKKLFIERFPGIWSRTSYNHKLILRNLFLNKRKALASSIGIIASTVLLITALGTQSALQKIANQIEEVYTYDFKVDYKTDSSLETLQLPSGIKHQYLSSTFPVEFIKGRGKENATLVVTEKENHLIRFHDDNGVEISLQNNGVLVPKSYADHYNIAEGDTVQIKFTEPGLHNQSVDMKVIKISSQYNNPSFYITPAYLKSFNIDYSPTSLLVEANNVSDLPSIRSFFEQDELVDTIADKTNLKESAQYILKQNRFMFMMFIISAVVLSIGAVYTISSINIYERKRELATLKVLGYPKNKINRLIFVENVILTAFAVIVALPIGIHFYALVVQALSSTHQQIPDQLNLSVMLISVLLAFVLTVLCNLLLRIKVTKINMIESLKSVE